jgi:hypothetical protein
MRCVRAEPVRCVARQDAERAECCSGACFGRTNCASPKHLRQTRASYNSFLRHFHHRRRRRLQTVSRCSSAGVKVVQCSSSWSWP